MNTSLPRDNSPKNCPLTHRKPAGWPEVRRVGAGNPLLVAWFDGWRECKFLHMSSDDRRAVVKTASGGTMEVGALEAIRVPRLDKDGRDG